MQPRNFRRSIIAILTILFSGCATAPPVAPPLTPEERIRQENTQGADLAEEFESKVALKADVDVAVYLRGLADRLAKTSPVLSLAPVGVMLLQDRDHVWRNHGLPGIRIYLSLGLLRGLEYENELAAAIAVQFAHILRRHALNRLDAIRHETHPASVDDGRDPLNRFLPPGGSRSSGVQYFGLHGIFAFSLDEHLAAAEMAVSMLYGAGFDPRGLVSLWTRYENHPNASPYDPIALSRLKERSRQTIAALTPLRNPIVRSEAFMMIQKRIRRL